MEMRFATGRLKVARHLDEWFTEYRMYHRIGGVVNKINDDLMAATRTLVMDIRFAKTLAPDRTGYGIGFRRQDAPLGLARGVNFDLFNPSVDY